MARSRRPSSPPDLPRIIPESWLPHFTPETLKKGSQLVAQGKVTLDVWDADSEEIFATVEDPKWGYLEVYLDVEQENGHWKYCSCICDCGAQDDESGIEECTHVAAVLLHLPTLAAPRDLSPSRSPAKATATYQTLAVDAWMDLLKEAEEPSNPTQPSNPDRVFFIIEILTHDDRRQVQLSCCKAKLKKNGQPGVSSAISFQNLIKDQPARYVSPEDTLVARLALAGCSHAYTYENSLPLDGVRGHLALEAALKTGRCHYATIESHPLKPAPPRNLRLDWTRLDNGHLQPSLAVEPAATDILLLDPPWFIDAPLGVCGPTENQPAPAILQAWISGPTIEPLQVDSIRSRLARRKKGTPLPLPKAVPMQREEQSPFQAVLHLSTRRLQWWESPHSFRDIGPDGLLLLVARPRFQYGDLAIPPSHPESEISRFNGQSIHVTVRNHQEELRLKHILLEEGLEPAIHHLRPLKSGDLDDAFSCNPQRDPALAKFLHRSLPRLQAAGWNIETDPSFEGAILRPEGWYLHADEHSGTDWFNLELGVRIGDEKINLLPVLLQGLRQNLHTFDPQSLARRQADDEVLISLPDGRRIPFPVDRLRAILATLVELHSASPLDPAGRITVHRLRAIQLGDLSQAPDWHWKPHPHLQSLAHRLRQSSPAEPLTPPLGFRTELRPYQLDGLSWIQFLREFDLGGILADDMGLGKTVQALAHVLLEKEQGRLDRPALVVCPTSVLPNWLDEAARFAPDLRTLTLHGHQRHEHFENLKHAELVLTTYPLLSRDAEILAETPYHCVILDEAQNVKNPRTHAAQVVARLQARHRLCMTGTPMENHLGELWSLFRFLLPGFLGDERSFRTHFRNPIERDQDQPRRQELARRIRPFLLRRRKDQVAQELPPKTEIVRQIELSSSQRDLYETIRLAMEQRVREEVDRLGLQRSQIVILDALLKLRQVCCDPRLVPLEAAREVRSSAKLDDLIELITPLLEEGRRILLFSQFTSMLALIGERLDSLQLPYLLLTGDTDDRATPVRRFQNLEVPLFLISLKAGGSGLNLTAADTVILYDPWWNPSVEAQAMDRAHRIGQEKPVFVYRLLTVGTVEERMNQLQERKRELVQALLDDGASRSFHLQPEDIDLLFSPIQ